MVAHVLVVAGVLPAARRPPPGESSQASQVAPRCRRCGSRDRGCARSSRSRGRSSSQCRAQDLRLVHEAVETDLPVGVRRRAWPRCAASPSRRRRRPRSAGSCWIGFGSQYAPSKVRCLPWIGDGLLGPQPLHDLERLLEDLQPVRRAGDTVMPYAWYSRSYQPAPRPKISRPPENTSTHAASLASSPALRYAAHVTSWPSWIVVVCCASAASVVNASNTCVGSRRRHGLDVVVHPEVVVAERLGELRDLLRARPRVGRTPAGVLELPALRRERARSGAATSLMLAFVDPRSCSPTTGSRPSSAAGTHIDAT